MIHDEIANRLTNPEEAVRLDALKKVHVCTHVLYTPSFLIRFLIVAVVSRSRFSLALIHHKRAYNIARGSN